MYFMLSPFFQFHPGSMAQFYKNSVTVFPNEVTIVMEYFIRHKQTYSIYSLLQNVN